MKIYAANKVHNSARSRRLGAKLLFVSAFFKSRVTTGAIAAALLLVGAGLPLRSYGSAAGPDAAEIVRRSEAIIRARSIEGKGSMTVKTPDWQRTLDLEFWDVTPDKTFIRVTGPAKDAGTATLRLGSNMWNYLPQVERVIKIPPSLMLQPWLGSDFSNDDLVKESSLTHDYTHEIIGEAKVDGDDCYIIKSTPKPDAPVVWGQLRLSIRKSDYLPLRQEFFNTRGQVEKVLYYSDIRRVDGRPYPMRWRMVSSTKPGHETTLAYSDLRFDRAIPSRIFTQQNLKQQF